MIEEDAGIVFNRQIADKTYHMGLESPLIAAAAKPGQFVMLRVFNGIDPLLRRPLSICRVGGGGIFYLLYRVVGRGTAIMSRAVQGERLSVLGPLGSGFKLPPPGDRSFLVAGGIGIAPLISLAQVVDKDHMAFLAGYRSATEIIPADQVYLDTKVSIATDDGTAGHRGPVTELLKVNVEKAGEGRAIVFACGPLPMLKAVAALTSKWNIPCQVSLETSMACGVGACQGCAVKSSSGQEKPYHHVCQDGPVFDADTVDWGRL
jgi:dihydroorotate dehydrogenase electron transfer subunit